MKHYTIFKYHDYTIKGCGDYYELYHPDGLIGAYNTCAECKAYVDRERAEDEAREIEFVLAYDEELRGRW